MEEKYYRNDDSEASSLGSKSYAGGRDDGGNVDDVEGESLASHHSNHYMFIPANSHGLPRIMTAGDELESLCRAEMSGGGGGGGILGFPPMCLPIVGLLPGNHCCVDCGDENQERLKYASIGYGTVLCKECACRHISISDEVSFHAIFSMHRSRLLECITIQYLSTNVFAVGLRSQNRNRKSCR